MTQLILDTEGVNLQLPESKKGGYTVTKQPLSNSVQMISGRTVREVRGNVWIVEYQYGYLSKEQMLNFLIACDKGIREPIECSFLPQESSAELTSESFFVEEYTRPKFMWSRSGEPLWGDFSVKLKGVYPID